MKVRLGRFKRRGGEEESTALTFLILRQLDYCFFYRPQTKLWEGNVFTAVCELFCSQGEGGLPYRTLPPGHRPLWIKAMPPRRIPLRQRPTWTVTLPWTEPPRPDRQRTLRQRPCPLWTEAPTPDKDPPDKELPGQRDTRDRVPADRDPPRLECILLMEGETVGDKSPFCSFFHFDTAYGDN